MLSQTTKKYLKTLFNYAVTVISCVVIIVLGIAFLSRATTVTTTIGENISTNDLIVYGNATTTGAHYVGGNLTVNGNFTVSGAQTISGAITIPYFTATSTTATSTIAGGFNIGLGRFVSDFSSGNTWLGSGNFGIGTTNPSANLHVYQDNPTANKILFQIGTSDDTSRFTIDEDGDVSTDRDITLGNDLNISGNDILDGSTAGPLRLSSKGDVYLNMDWDVDSTTSKIIFGKDATIPTGSDILMVIQENGNVGVGTTSPYAKLSVVGETVSLYFTATSTAATSTLPYLTSTQLALTGLTAGSIPFIGAGGIISQNNANLYWDNTNTRLGIGTNNPQALLHIQSSIAEPRLRITETGDTATTHFTGIDFYDSDTFQGGIYKQGTTHRLSFWNSSTEAMSILQTSGNVGIGTTTPYAKLSVAGIGAFDNYVRASYFTATSTTATSTFPYLTSTQTAITGLTAGSIPFIGAGGIVSQNNANLYWDNTNTRLGIGTSTPWAKLSVTNSGTGPSFIVEDAASPDASPFIIDASGNVGIGTTTSVAKLSVQGTGTGLNQTFAVFNSTAATSTFVVLDNGYVGVGTSTPWGRFSVEQGASDNNVFIVADAGTSTPHLRIDGGGNTYIEKLNTGPMAFNTNAGVVSWINLNIDSSVATGTIESYTAQIDDVNVLTVYGESAGSGLIGTTSVGIGTTTPVGYFTINASTTAPMAALSVWNVNTAPEGPLASFYDGGTEVMRLDASGRLGLGTSTFASTLTIGTANAKVAIANGGLCVDSDGGCNASTTGRISAVSFVTAASDLAENYYSDETLSAGDIVITKGGPLVGKADEANQTAVIGIVSTKPGIILGLENDNPAENMPLSATGIYPVALAGRVPVKVNSESGSISVGDPLSLSSEAGVAQKASEPGQIIGYALEDYDGPTEENNGQIIIFINITYWFPSDYFVNANPTGRAQSQNNEDNDTNIVLQSLDWILDQFKDIGLTIKNGIVQAQEFAAEKITAKKAVLDAIEMKDAATGEIYCLRLENGELNRILGECAGN